jgi:CspA family cold shock protein
MTPMSTGTVASLRDKGFGFIAPDGAAARGDIFFHRSGVVDDRFDWLVVGQRVSFDAEPDPRDATRRRAVNVRAVEDGAAGEATSSD